MRQLGIDDVQEVNKEAIEGGVCSQTTCQTKGGEQWDGRLCVLDNLCLTGLCRRCLK